MRSVTPKSNLKCLGAAAPPMAYLPRSWVPIVGRIPRPSDLRPTSQRRVVECPQVRTARGMPIEIRAEVACPPAPYGSKGNATTVTRRFLHHLLLLSLARRNHRARCRGRAGTSGAAKTQSKRSFQRRFVHAIASPASRSPRARATNEVDADEATPVAAQAQTTSTGATRTRPSRPGRLKAYSGAGDHGRARSGADSAEDRALRLEVLPATAAAAPKSCLHRPARCLPGAKRTRRPTNRRRSWRRPRRSITPPRARPSG